MPLPLFLIIKKYINELTVQIKTKLYRIWDGTGTGLRTEHRK